jgi:hypothetical protein
MKKLNKNLSEIFDVEPIPSLEEKTKTTEIVEISATNTIDQDAEVARNNLKSILSKGNSAIEELAIVARDSQHPRAYEVLAGMMKNLADINKDLLEIQKRKQDLTGTKPSNTKDVNIDKAVFVGSTAELMKLIKTNKEV